MANVSRSLLSLLILFVGIFMLTTTSASGQLTEIENKLPKSVPLEVEFKNYDKENWWRDLELKVTNTGKKPIYYLWLILQMNVTNPVSGRQGAISFKFGDLRKFYPASSDGIADANDPAILPNKSYTFYVSAASVKAWDMLSERGDFIEPRKAELDHGGTRFGDGTGLESGGSPIKKNPPRGTF
ncbi:MAG: hypothetical protein ACRD6X_08925 [Pyrinomonadaceae bacterium]